MILYHGSKEIVKSPEIRIQKYNKDFYFGFYCTLFPEQAIRWATRFGKAGYLNEYEYPPTHQISFHTARALTTLTYVRGVEVNNEE